MAEMENCWDSNSDGFGFMYSTGKDVYWNKGYMKKASFQKVYQSILDNSGKWARMTWVFHFRIATHGGKGQQMTHPFPVTKDHKEILRLSGKSPIGFAHNGILTSVPTDNVYSDTANYVRMFLSKIDTSDKKLTQYFLDETSNASRFSMLYADGSFLKAGSWIDHGGCFWSNTSYESFDWTDHEWERGWRQKYEVSSRKTTLGTYNHLTMTYDYSDDDATVTEQPSGELGLKRLPDYMLVYGSDGTVYRQGSHLLVEGEEEFWIDSESGELYILGLATGSTDLVDYVTDALGKVAAV
jgi:hypothetical protein